MAGRSDWMTDTLRRYCAGLALAFGLACSGPAPLVAQQSGTESAVQPPAEDSAPALDTTGLAGNSVAARIDDATGEVAVEVAVPGTLFLPVDEAEEAALSLSLQQELNRLGCDAGAEDGAWGRRSEEALERLRQAVPTAIEITPSLTLLAILQEMPEGTCPLVCSAREEKIDGACRLKTCPAGHYLDSRGNCQVRVVKKATPAPKSGGGGGKKCVTYNSRTYCN